MNLENLEQKSKPVEIHTERKKDREIENAESNIFSCLMGWPMFLIAVDDLYDCSLLLTKNRNRCLVSKTTS